LSSVKKKIREINYSGYQLLKRTYPACKIDIKDNYLIDIITKHDTKKCLIYTIKYMQIQNILCLQL